MHSPSARPPSGGAQWQSQSPSGQRFAQGFSAHPPAVRDLQDLALWTIARGGMETRALPTPGTLPDWLTKSGLLLGSTMAALLLGEVVVRIVAPQQLIILRPDIWMPVDSVGLTFRPFVHSTINTGERPGHVVTDSQGFRVSAGGRPSARTRVLLIGDSFMAALQVEYEQSLAGLLEKGLKARLG